MADSIDENNYVCHLPVIVSSPKNRLQHALNKCVEIKKDDEIKRRKKSLFVYVIKCRKYVKIGVADNVQIRVSCLQVGCPYKFKLLHYWRSKDAIKEEETIHTLLDEYRVRGEWFKLPEYTLALWLHTCPDYRKDYPA